MPVEVAIFSPNAGAIELPEVEFLYPAETITLGQAFLPDNSAQETVTCVICDENNSGFWIGSSVLATGNDDTISAEISDQQFFNKTSIVIEPIPGGGLAYICYQEEPNVTAILYDSGAHNG